MFPDTCTFNMVFTAIRHHLREQGSKCLKEHDGHSCILHRPGPVSVQDSVYRGKPVGKLGRRIAKLWIPTKPRYELSTELFVSVKTVLLPRVLKNVHLQESFTANQGSVFGN